MKKRLLFVFLYTSFSCLFSTDTEWISCNNFKVKKNVTLKVLYDGNIFIEKDYLSYSDDFLNADFSCESENNKKILTIKKDNGNGIKYRKEISVTDKKIEITVMCSLSAYRNNPRQGPLRYQLYIPSKFFKDFKYSAFVGRCHSIKKIIGKLKKNNSESLTGTKWNRFITFSNGKIDIVFDFNPYGISSGQDYCSWGEPVGCWQIKNDKNYIICSFGSSTPEYGKTIVSKLIIYGEKKYFDKLHAHKSWGYEGAISPCFRFASGYTTPPEKYLNIDNSQYTPQKQWGWQYEDTERNGKTFWVDLQPGIYIMTLNFEQGENDNNSIDLFLNGTLCKKINPSKGGKRFNAVTCAFRLNSNQLKVKFVSNKENINPFMFSIQPLLFQNEDLGQGLWNSHIIQ